MHPFRCFRGLLLAALLIGSALGVSRAAAQELPDFTSQVGEQVMINMQVGNTVAFTNNRQLGNIVCSVTSLNPPTVGSCAHVGVRVLSNPSRTVRFWQLTRGKARPTIKTEQGLNGFARVYDSINGTWFFIQRVPDGVHFFKAKSRPYATSWDNYPGLEPPE
jgi:hypothetical protein